MEDGGMDPKDVFSLGLGLNEPWKLAGHRLDVEKRPHELHLEVVADRGALFPCPDCKRACKAHDFESFTWRHLNFFQHHCFITARVPRVDCPDHGVKRVTVPWARAGSRFTLLFEQAALILAREMPVAAAARFMGITDKRLWRILQHYVARAVGALDLGSVRAVGLDETASKRGHNYVTVFIDMDRADKPVIFATPGKGKACVAAFRTFLLSHRGEPTRVAEVVCDMSPAFLAALATSFPKAAVTVDWFHVVQLFTTAVDQVRKAEARSRQLPKAIRWAVLRAGDGALTDDQRIALAELETGGFATAAAYRAKEMLRWIRHADTPQAARWRITRFINHIGTGLQPTALLDPVRRALGTVATHTERIIQRWKSSHSNARLEGLNGIFQAARARARGYRNTATYITIIYLLAAPLPDILKSI
jgi:transposase